MRNVDVVPPTVSMTAPVAGATVSRTVTLSAEASDNNAVAGVQFLVDGAALGAEVRSAPYSTAWDSTQAANGVHTLAARARDSAGNRATSTTVDVSVANAATVQLEIAPPIGGFVSPLDLKDPADGSGRLFVVQQGGIVRIVQGGQLTPLPFIDISTRPGFTWGGETGLLGLAFHPNYASNGRFFVNYTRNLDGQLQTVIAEYRASPPGAGTANVNSERVLFTWDQPFANHNGGGLAFGADGFLYIGLGDGGSGGDPFCNAQNLSTLLGKMLRIDVDTPASGGAPYVVPPTNPFANQAGRRGEIWLYGLRNPFRFSFDRANGRDLFIGDVGQDAFEEVDLVGPSQAGANMGWNLLEGSHPYSGACTQTGVAPSLPIFDYSHADGDQTVIGGYVYRGSAIPALSGAYVFGDFISGRVWTLVQTPQGWVRSAQPVLTMGQGNLSSFGQDQAGELWVVRYVSGEVARIRQATASLAGGGTDAFMRERLAEPKR